MARPEAVFDCLYTASILQRQFSNSARGEIHLFTYLACLLSIYSGHAVDDWTYEFAGTVMGAPFSTEVDSAIDEVFRSGLMVGNDEFVEVTPNGLNEIVELMEMSFFSGRMTFLEAACSSVLALPVGIVRDALSNEPNLRPLSRLGTSRRLLDKAGLEMLYEHFDALREAVGKQVPDLMVPATVWLSYLAECSRPKLPEVRR